MQIGSHEKSSRKFFSWDLQHRFVIVTLCDLLIFHAGLQHCGWSQRNTVEWGTETASSHCQSSRAEPQDPTPWWSHVCLGYRERTNRTRSSWQSKGRSYDCNNSSQALYYSKRWLHCRIAQGEGYRAWYSFRVDGQERSILYNEQQSSNITFYIIIIFI